MELLARPPYCMACTAVDLPGFGFSPPPADHDYTLAAHAAAVIDLIEGEHAWPVHLVGNSMGGAVATLVAGRRPDLVRSLILISPAMPDLRPRLLPMRLALIAAPGVGQAVLGRYARVSADDRVDRTIAETFADPASMHPMRRDQEIEELLRRDRLGYADDALITSARSLVTEYFTAGPKGLWRDARRTRAPVLVLYGKHDKLVNPMMAGKAARSFRRARVVVLPGVGHVAMMERPAVVAAEIGSFLERDLPDRADTAAQPSAC
jgi:pimeloyl-ACP methyl ester carboxylesterase